MIKLIYKEKAFAKINLAIDVLKKRSDGYHDLHMIMQSIPLYDMVTVKIIEDDEIILDMDKDLLSKNDTNIVYKTAKLIKEKYKLAKGAKIYIEKNIPLAAGLAGGSADAATSIKLLDKAWNLNMNESDKKEIAKTIGADVSFCLNPGTALAQGIGDKLIYLNPLPSCYVLLIKPDISISTKEIYESLDLGSIKIRPDIKGMLESLSSNNLYGVTDRLCNVLEGPAIKKCREIPLIKQKLIEYGALGSIMSGSGPSVFGIFDDKDKAYEAYEQALLIYKEVHLLLN